MTVEELLRKKYVRQWQNKLNKKWGSWATTGSSLNDYQLSDDNSW